MEDLIGSIKEYFVIQPRRLSTPCDLAMRLCCVIFVLGLIGHVAITGHRAIASLGAQPVGDPTLADLMPDALTWFVPETFVGYLVVAAVLVAAACGRAVGRRIDQMYRLL